MKKKLTSSLTGAFVFIILINILSRGLGFFREILFANYFGLGVNFDVYLVGAVLPITINTVIIYIGQNYFIPAYHTIKVNDKHSAQKFFNLNFIAFVVIGIITTLLLYLFSNAIIDIYLKSNDESIRIMTVRIFRIFLLTIPLNFAISILTAYEQAEYEFKFPAIGRLFLNLTVIPVLIIFTDKFGIYTVPIGFVIGTVFQLLYLVFKGKSSLMMYSFSGKIDKNISVFFDITLITIILIEIIGQVYMLSDRYFFYSVDRGGISALSYASNIFNLPISVVSLALATVIFPKFSENIQSKSFDKIQKNFSNAVRVNFLVFIPITFLFFFYGDIIIKIFFQRGKFSAGDTLDTFFVLRVYAVSLIFFSTYSIINKVLYGAKLVNHLLIITIVGIAIKVGFNFIFVEHWKQNGLALSTSLSYIFFFLASYITIYRKLPLKDASIFFKELLLHLINGFVVYLIIEMIFSAKYPENIFVILMKIFLYLLIYTGNIFIVKSKSLSIVKELINSLESVKLI